MSPWIEAAMAKYGWIWIGLTFGLAAKYALLIKRGIRIRPILILADVLLLPMVALIAYWLVQRAGAEDEAAALISCGVTVGADRIIKLYMERFMQRVDATMIAMAEQRKAEIRNEVQTEISGKAVIEDQLTGRAPEEYAALRKPPII